MTTKRVLWRATIGSHMWEMEHPGSDIDIFEVYILDTPSVLVGENVYKGEERKEVSSDGTPIDVVSHEIGHVVRELQKGNINFLHGVMSYLSEHPDEFGKKIHNRLIHIITMNLSKNYFWAMRGLMRKNLLKYFKFRLEESDDDGNLCKVEFIPTGDKITISEEKQLKKINQIGRVLLQGIILFESKYIYFKKTSLKNTEDILSYYGVLKRLYEDCGLPEKPDPKPFRDFLIETRMMELVK